MLMVREIWIIGMDIPTYVGKTESSTIKAPWVEEYPHIRGEDYQLTYFSRMGAGTSTHVGKTEDARSLAGAKEHPNICWEDLETLSVRFRFGGTSQHTLVRH